MSPPFASGPAQTETIWSAPLPRADVAESVDAPDLKSIKINTITSFYLDFSMTS